MAVVSTGFVALEGVGGNARGCRSKGEALTCIMSFRTLGTSEKKKRAKTPATTPKPAMVRPLYHEVPSEFSLSSPRLLVTSQDAFQTPSGRKARDFTEGSRKAVTYNRAAVLTSMPWKFFRIL